MSDANTQTTVDDQGNQGNQGNQGDQCSICLGEKDRANPKNTTVTECGHLFCTTCLLKHLAIRNTCPNCRAEIEPARAPTIEPLTATIVSNIIQEEEATVDVARRIAVIGAFPASEGRNGMILSLIREVAFGAGHSLAAWQGTDETTYHASWNEFEYTQQPDEDDDDEEEDDGEDGEDDNSESGSGSGSDASSDDGSDADNDAAEGKEVDDDDVVIGEKRGTHTRDTVATVATLATVATVAGGGGGNVRVRAAFQSPAHILSPPTFHEPIAPIAAVSVSPRPVGPVAQTYAYSNLDIIVRVAIFAFALYMKM